MVKNLVRFISAIILLVGMAVIAQPEQIIYASSDTFYPDADPETSSCDGYVLHQQTTTTWSNLVNGAGTSASAAGNTLGINITDTLTNEYLYLQRSILVFDTSDLPNDAIITSVTLSLWGSAKLDQKACTPNINVYSAAPVGDTDIVAGDYDSLGTTAYSTAISYGDWTTGAYNVFTLNSTGEAAIAVDDVTYFGIRNANYDVANIAPGIDSGGKVSYLSFYSADYSSGTYAPKLIVNYYQIVAPSITANAASNIAQTSARLNSTLTDDGLEECEIRFGFGETTQTAGNFTSYDTVTDWVDGYETGQNPYYDASGLSDDTTHYFRVQAKNSAGTTTSDEVTFDTLAALNEPSAVYAYPESTSIYITWNKGVGSSNTLIRYSYTTYPTATNEGIELYEDSGSSYEHTGLDPGTLVYYSLWGESGESYSASYASIAMSTGASGTEDGDLDEPTQPGGWFQLPDDTALENFEPFYSVINDAADNWDMPRGTLWVILGLVISALIATIVFMISNALLWGGIAGAGMIALITAIGILQLWMGAVIIIAMGMFLMRRL